MWKNWTGEFHIFSKAHIIKDGAPVNKLLKCDNVHVIPSSLLFEQSLARSGSTFQQEKRNKEI